MRWYFSIYLCARNSWAQVCTTSGALREFIIINIVFVIIALEAPSSRYYLSLYLSIWIEAGNSVHETAERTIIVWVDPNVIQHTIRCGHAAVACAPAPAYSGPHCCAAARLCARDDHGDAQRGEFPKGAFGDTGRTLRKRARARRRKLGARCAIAARAYGARHAFKNSQSTEPEGVRRHT